MRLLKEDAIAIVVDVQERLFPVIHEKETLERHVNILVQGVQTLEIPIIVTEQYKKGLGETINSLRQLVDSYPHIEKIAFSCCDDAAFMTLLNQSGKKTVILAGIESHICLLQTAIDLKARGFVPVVIEDCVSSRTYENKRIAMERLRHEGVIVSSCESVLFELCRVAVGDAFKTISKLIK